MNAKYTSLSHQKMISCYLVWDPVSWLLIFVTWQAVTQRLLSSLVASYGQQGTGWMI